MGCKIPEGRVLPPNTVKQNGAKYDPPYPTAPDTTNKYWRYEYDIKDHLGNLRVACRCAEQIETAQTNRNADRPEIGYAPTVVQQAHYDPWGVKLPLFLSNGKDRYKGSPEDRFKFQGKEELKETGWYDFGARMYDPQIGGRFLSIDPRASEMPSWSPYSSFFGNPVRYIDPDGQAPFDITLLGANNSSVTVKTDLVNLRVNASSLGVDFGGNYTLSGNDILQAAVDIGGVFDPTPTLDILGASLSAKSGDYWGAAASGLGAAVPYVGDLAKTGKIAKGIDKISDAIDAAKGADNAKGGVYALKDGETVVRTGRTTDLARRETEHANDATLGKYKFETKHRTDNYAEQRGLEHKVSKQYESTASKANGGHNKINAIGDKNPNKAKYIQAADDYLKR